MTDQFFFSLSDSILVTTKPETIQYVAPTRIRFCIGVFSPFGIPLQITPNLSISIINPGLTNQSVAKGFFSSKQKWQSALERIRKLQISNKQAEEINPEFYNAVMRIMEESEIEDNLEKLFQ